MILLLIDDRFKLIFLVHWHGLLVVSLIVRLEFFKLPLFHRYNFQVLV